MELSVSAGQQRARLRVLTLHFQRGGAAAAQGLWSREGLGEGSHQPERPGEHLRHGEAGHGPVPTGSEGCEPAEHRGARRHRRKFRALSRHFELGGARFSKVSAEIGEDFDGKQASRAVRGDDLDQQLEELLTRTDGKPVTGGE